MVFSIFAISILFLMLSMNSIASECDNWETDHPDWLVCEDFEGFTGTEGNNQDFIDWLGESPWLKESSDITPGRITITDVEENVFYGEHSLYYPAAATDGYRGSALGWYDCIGEKRNGCTLNGHEQLYMRAYFKRAPDHQYVHHFFSVGGSQSDGFWDSMGLAGCRPKGFIKIGTTIDFKGTTGESHFYTYSMDMSCDPGWSCDRYADATEICSGCAGRGLPCENGEECCWGNHYENDDPVYFPKDEWICLELTIKANTPNVKDGYMAYWVNDELVQEESEMLWRSTSDLQLNRATLQHYITSSDADGHSNKIWWDNAIISTEKIGCYQPCEDEDILCVDDTSGPNQEYDDIQEAIDDANPGATILIYDGEYRPSSTLKIRNPGLTIKSVNKHGAKIITPINDEDNFDNAMFVCNWADDHCQDTDFDLVIDGIDISGGYVYTIQITTARNVIIKNSKVHGPGREGFKINGDEGHSQNVIVEDCEIYDTGLRADNAEGVDITSSYNITLRNNYFHDIRTCGFYAKKESRDILFENNIINRADCGLGLGQSSPCTNCVARNNLIMNTENMGIQARGSTNGKIYHNTLYNVAKSGAAAIWIAQDDSDTQTSNLELYNNIIYMDSPRPVLQTGTDSMPSIDELHANNNIWYNAQGVKFRISPTDRTLTEWQTYSGEESNSIEADPIFVNVGSDFHLTQDSPAIDVGLNVGVNLDLDGNSRPNGNGYDIGAYESGYNNDPPPLEQCTNADENEDGVISNGEMDEYIALWLGGDVNLIDLFNVIDKWKEGC